MTKEFCEIVVSDGPLAPPPLRFTTDAGGVVDFYGVVRGREEGESIRGIDYEAHLAMARHQLARLAEEASERFPILGLTLHHRVGFVPAAEASLFLRVGAAHRGPAFEAAQWLIERLKQRVPIWKRPILGEPGVAGAGASEARSAHVASVASPATVSLTFHG